MSIKIEGIFNIRNYNNMDGNINEIQHPALKVSYQDSQGYETKYYFQVTSDSKRACLLNNKPVCFESDCYLTSKIKSREDLIEYNQQHPEKPLKLGDFAYHHSKHHISYLVKSVATFDERKQGRYDTVASFTPHESFFRCKNFKQVKLDLIKKIELLLMNEKCDFYEAKRMIKAEAYWYHKPIILNVEIQMKFEIAYAVNCEKRTLEQKPLRSKMEYLQTWHEHHRDTDVADRDYDKLLNYIQLEEARKRIASCNERIKNDIKEIANLEEKRAQLMEQPIEKSTKETLIGSYDWNIHKLKMEIELNYQEVDKQKEIVDKINKIKKDTETKYEINDDKSE